MSPILSVLATRPANDMTTGIVNAKNDPYFATGLGVADDHAAIQGALDALNALGGGAVLLPAGIYSVTAPLEIYPKTLLIGTGWDTVITSATANPIIRFNGTADFDGNIARGIGIESLCIDGGSVGAGLTGVYATKQVGGGGAEAGRTTWMKRCLVQNCATGMRLINDQGIHISDTKFIGNGTGLYASDDSQLGHAEDCDFRNNSVVGTRLEGSAAIIGGTADRIYGWQFDRCHWESNTGKGVVLDGAGYNTFSTCKWENNTGTFVEAVNTVSGYRCDGNTFINGTWNGTVGTPAVWQVDLVQAYATIFHGGQFNPGDTSGIRLGAAAYNTAFLFSTITAGKLTDNSNWTYVLSPAYGLQELRVTTGLPLNFRVAGGGVAASIDDAGAMSAQTHMIGDRGMYSGSGSPEGVLSAQVGSIYLRTNGGAGTSLYVKESGGGNTGWAAK